MAESNQMADKRLENIIHIIRSEADDKAQSIMEEAKQRATTLENKAYGIMKNQLVVEFDKKKENDEVRVKT